jgi:DNA-binding FadR family transcriptional regulator
LRRAIRPVAAEIAATSQTSDGLTRITEAFERTERFRNSDGDIIDSNGDLHVGILEATQNHPLAALGEFIQAARSILIHELIQV